MKAAEALVDCLIQEGVDTVFGIPGSKFLETLDAMWHRREEIRFITTRHEQGAAFMAMGYAMARGSVGVCYATLGPGTTNLVTGIADAFKNAVPVVALGGMIASESLGRDAWQDIDQAAILRPVTKESTPVPLAGSLPLYLRRAFRAAAQNLPGPVYLGIPMEQLPEEIDHQPLGRERYRGAPCPEVVIPEERLDAIAGLLRSAKAPVILTGRELRWEQMDREVLEFAAALQIPVITTSEGHGGLPTTHPLVLGPTGNSGWPVANECLRNADLILALGVKFDLHGTGFGHRFVPRDAALVHVSRFAEFIGTNFPVTVGLQAPVVSFLRALGSRTTSSQVPAWDAGAWRSKLDGWRKSRDEKAEVLRRARPLKPQCVAAALSPYAVPGTFFTFDGGNFKKFLVKGMELQGSGLLFKDDGYGCVGSALPTALGYQAGRADARVFCVTGDMGYLLNGAELETAVREKLPVVTVIFNDRGLGNIREYQDRKYAGRHMGVDYAPVDYAAAARAFGAYGETVTDPDEVGPAIERALASGKPAVLDMLVDPDELAPKE
jgi:thiamine pyrophosphate-dependent acetolactate synthase large subunit-like protein